MRSALAWAGATTAAEALARGLFRGRSAAWIASYGALWIVARRPRDVSRAGLSRGAAVLGLALSLGGYPLGRRLLQDAPSTAPPDSLVLELASLGVVVPAAEEAIWGTRVEPTLGVGGTAALFAAKHVVVDGRWRRGLGLAAFWTGLGLLRRRSPGFAAVLHHTCNAAAVLAGHLTGRDRF
ncbi:MAG: hypothetical protein M3450_09710 [Actinomycetota bacterium]|nr:hypothetical protein [Actinomycetota bacterium]